MDAVDVSKIVSAKVGGVVERLMNELVPEVKSAIAQRPEIQALPEGPVRSGAADLAAGTGVATLVIASTLALLRKANFPEEAREQVIKNARALDAANTEEPS